VRPFPSLRILFASPSLRTPGIHQLPFPSKIGGSPQVREELICALRSSRSVTAKILWLTNRDKPGDGRERWVHCTPLLNGNGDVGVWVVVLVDPPASPGGQSSRRRHIVDHKIHVQPSSEPHSYSHFLPEMHRADGANEWVQTRELGLENIHRRHNPMPLTPPSPRSPEVREMNSQEQKIPPSSSGSDTKRMRIPESRIRIGSSPNRKIHTSTNSDNRRTSSKSIITQQPQRQSLQEQLPKIRIAARQDSRLARLAESRPKTSTRLPISPLSNRRIHSSSSNNNIIRQDIEIQENITQHPMPKGWRLGNVSVSIKGGGTNKDKA
jgi:hypothetical protein